MNYSEPDGEQYNLALIRKPAVVPPESGFYRGPVLFNPGGPGGSGVDLIAGPRGELFSAILGPQFDILSFDPRGMSSNTILRFCPYFIIRNFPLYSPRVFL